MTNVVQRSDEPRNVLYADPVVWANTQGYMWPAPPLASLQAPHDEVQPGWLSCSDTWHTTHGLNVAVSHTMVDHAAKASVRL